VPGGRGLMPAQDRCGEEGRIVGGGDAAFHAAILGPDTLPPEVLERLREQARQAGLNPALLER
jgi:hypothetical protein